MATWKERVPQLVEALVKHEKEFKVDYNHFLTPLSSYDLQLDTQSNYYPMTSSDVLPQKIDNATLSIDGVLYNAWLRQVKIGLVPFVIKDKEEYANKSEFQNDFAKLKKFISDQYKKFTYENISSIKPLWNEQILDNLIKNDIIMEILVSMPIVPYSLLARLDIESEVEGQKMIQTRPVLVKPGISDFDENMIYDWQMQNMTKSTANDQSGIHSS